MTLRGERRLPYVPPPVERPATTRLACEPLGFAHEAELCRLYRDEPTMAWLAGVRDAAETRQLLESEAEHWQRHGFGLWAVRCRSDGRFLGRGGIRHAEVEGEPVVELAYALHARDWGRGLAGELAEAALAVGFERLGLERIVAFTQPHNRASRRVMEKAGFVYQREIVHAELPHVLYAVDREARGEPGYRVRLATPEEAAALSEIERAAAALFEPGSLAPGVLEDVTPRADFEDAQGEQLLWVAIGPGGRPVGFALVEPFASAAHLDELDVHPAHGRRGLGAALLRAVCAGAARRGFEAVTLTTFRDVAWNAPFYARHGFRALAPEELGPELTRLVEREAARGLPAEDRVVMRFDTTELG